MIWIKVGSKRLSRFCVGTFTKCFINKFLKINTKRYIKKTACFPETVTKQDFLNIELDITNDEMIHLNLMICEARFEAQLVYMLHAIQKALDLV